MNSFRSWVGSQRGAVRAAASLIGVPQPLLSQWMSGARKTPPDRCPAIERATDGNVTVEQLRPDVRWVRVPDPNWPHPQGRPCIDVAAPAAPAEEVRDAA